MALVVKNPPASAGRHKRQGFDPRVRKIPWRRAGQPTQYSCLENPTDRGTWWAAVHSVAQHQTRLKRLSMTALLQQCVFTHVLSLCWDGPRYLSHLGTDNSYLNTAVPTLGISLNMPSRAASQVARRPSQFQLWWFGASLVAQPVKSLSAMQETQVWSLGLEDHGEKSMATHSSILAWRIPWTEELGGLQSIGSQRVGGDWSNLAHTQAWKCIK